MKFREPGFVELDEAARDGKKKLVIGACGTMAAAVFRNNNGEDVGTIRRGRIPTTGEPSKNWISNR